MAIKRVAVFDNDGKYLSHCTYERANKLVHSKKAFFIGIDMLRLKTGRKQIIRDKHDVIRKDEYRCYICNNYIKHHNKRTVDHVIPKSRDKMFADTKENMRCCCDRCNLDKDNRTIIEYVRHIRNHREKYTYISNKRLDYLERYAIQYEKDYYERTRLKGGDIQHE